ncbi:MAG TPA: hypothetical protein VFZ25_13350, partial [Chloroflexota bacterium]|nr:hypothetical protein [Chloroflexota bacterium]
EWPILAQRAGFRVAYVEVDGVDWETPDQFRTEAADQEARREIAERYDQRADRWERRVQTAREIIREGIAAKNRELTIPDDR